ncbi:MAG: helix-turn-helix domain-containing protein [Lachnospira sp.]|nr:helix-turn-helix domain-containing protein [Lachnospira sp.]
MNNQLQHFELSRLNRTPDESMHTPHTHSYYELFYLISGECELQLGQSIYTITPRTAIFIPSNVPHKTTYKDPNGNERLNIEFSANYVSDLEEEFGQMWLDRYVFGGPLHFSPVATPAISAAITRLEVDCASTKKDTSSPTYGSTVPSNSTLTKPIFTFGDVTNSPYDGVSGKVNRFGSISSAPDDHDIFANCMRKFHLQELIITLLRRCTQTDYITTDQMQIADISVREAKKYIEQNYAEPLTLDDLASRYQLNSTYFSNKFKNINGIGFKEYLNNIRIIHAERLLLETTKSITQIALECGYESSNYFGDVFRKINKVSPSQFRKLKGFVKK